MATLPGFPSLAVIGFGKQSAAGTSVAPAFYCPWGTIAKFQPMILNEKYRDGTDRDLVFDAKEGEWYEFDFTTQLRPSVAMQLLVYALGATDAVGNTTGTMSATTLTGAGNVAGSTSITATATANAAVGDVLLIGTVGTSPWEFVVVKTVTSGTVLALQTPLQNSYIATTPLANASASIYAHYGSQGAGKLPLLSMTHAIGDVGIGTSSLDIVRITDCLVSDWDLAVDGAKYGLVNVKGMGRIGVPGQSVPSVSYETDRALTFADAVYAFTGVTITGGTADITRTHLNVKNTIEKVPVHGSIVPQLFNAERVISCDFDVFAEDQKLWRDVFWGTDAGTTYLNANTIASSIVWRYDLQASVDHLVQLYMNNVVMDDVAPTFDVNAKPFKFKAKGTAKKGALSAGASSAILQYLVLNGDTTSY